MLTLERIRVKLQHMNINSVARQSGVHQNAIYRIMKGSDSARYETVKKLSDFLEALDDKAS